MRQPMHTPNAAQILVIKYTDYQVAVNSVADVRNLAIRLSNHAFWGRWLLACARNQIFERRTIWFLNVG
jgi:hypothetical protein